MNDIAHTILSKAYDLPDILAQIPDPPGRLYVRSTAWSAVFDRPWIAVVGSRHATPYGRAVTTTLVAGLSGSGVGVVSGLAIGIDGIAHLAALDGGIPTIAVLAGGLDAIYPQQHYYLANRILKQGGALISEYPDGTPHHKHHFVARNRIVSGLCQAVLITEAAARSGTLHTAAFALEQGREVLVVPGPITNPQSAGTNQLLKTGATPVTSVQDILAVLGIPAQPAAAPVTMSADEQAIVNGLKAGISDGSQLLAYSGLGISRFNQSLTMLEINGHVHALGANTWTLR